MKTATMKNAAVIASLLLATGYAGVGAAHEKTESLGAAPTASDLYLISCYDDGNGTPAKLVFSVSDLNPPAAPFVAMSVRKGKSAWKTVVDRVDGDNNSSPQGVLAKRGGTYKARISKAGPTRTGSEIYNATFHCMTASNVHTGTSEPVIIRNQ
jgi:hypothetical protein